MHAERQTNGHEPTYNNVQILQLAPKLLPTSHAVLLLHMLPLLAQNPYLRSAFEVLSEVIFIKISHPICWRFSLQKVEGVVITVPASPMPNVQPSKKQALMLALTCIGWSRCSHNNRYHRFLEHQLESPSWLYPARCGPRFWVSESLSLYFLYERVWLTSSHLHHFHAGRLSVEVSGILQQSWLVQAVLTTISSITW